MSGARDDRPGLAALLDYVREGDTVVVWKLDRLGRNTLHILETVKELTERGMTLVSTTDGIDKLRSQRLFPRAAHNVEWVCPRYPNCGQDAAKFETGPRVSRDRCARRSPHNRRHAASDSHSARPGPFLRNVRRSIRTYLADHHRMGRQRDDGP